MAKPPGKCIFCGGGNLSKEHIWPNWLKPYIPRNPRPTSAHGMSLGAYGPDGYYSARRTGKLDRPGDIQSQRLRVVCQSCNSGWMSIIQKAAKPILIPFLDGYWPDIPRQHQSTLATWATMFTMVLEVANEGTSAPYQQGRSLFFLTKMPPPNWFIYVGAFQGHFWRGVFSQFGWVSDLEKKIPPASAMDHIDSHTTSFVMGSLFFMVCRSSADRDIRRMRNFQQGRPLRRIWPMRHQIARRPAYVLDDFEADEINAALQPALPEHTRRAWETPATWPPF